jgi:formylglycine-generating enzyme required for sulfatase activity
MKKLLTLIFALVAVMAGAFDNGDFTYTIMSDGTARIDGFKSSYTGTPTTLTIPGYVYDSGTQKYYQVKTIQNSAFSNNKTRSLTKVTIQYGVEDIYSYAFADCSSLTTVYLPSSIKGLANRVFNNTPLTYVNCAAEVMPSITEYGLAGITSDVNSRTWSCATPDGQAAANEVDRITSNFTTGWNPSSADLTELTFGSSSAGTLCNVYLNITEGWNPSTQDYGKAKLLCATANSSNTTGTLKFDYNQSVLQGMAHFYVTEIDKSFRLHGSSIKILDMSQTSKVEKIGAQAFYNCTNLTQAKVTAKVIEGGAFNYCTNLSSVQLYGTSESNCVQSLGTFAFARTKVSSIYIPAGLTSYGAGAFAYCTNLSSISVSSSNNTFATHAATPGCLYNKAKTILYQAAGKFGDLYFGNNAPDALTNITTYAFAGNTGMVSLDVPYGVKTIGSYAFTEMPNLISLSIPSSVTSFVSNSFYNLKALTLFSFNHATIPSSLNGSNTFYGIKSGCKLKVPKWRTAYYRNSVWNSAFSGGISEGSCDFYGYYSDNMFYYTVTSTASYTDDLVEPATTDGQLKLVNGGYGFDTTRVELILPDVVTHRGKTYTVTEIERETFRSDHISIKKVSGGAGIKKIGALAFAGDILNDELSWSGHSLSGFNIPNPVEFGDSMCMGCYMRDASLKIGERLERIGVRAFSKCFHGNYLIYYIREITLPETLTEIGDYAFDNCGRINYYITSTQRVTIGQNMFFPGVAKNRDIYGVIYAPLDQYLDISRQTQSWINNTEWHQTLRALYKPKTRWSLISVPDSRNLKMPDDHCYVVTGYNKSESTFSFAPLGENVILPGFTGILFKGTPGNIYKFEPSGLNVANLPNDYLVAPQGDAQYFSSSQGNGLVYVYDGASEMFNLQDATIYSGGAVLRIPQSVFGTDTPPVNVDCGIDFLPSVYINGVKVTAANASDLSVIDGVSGGLSFDFATNTLKMNNATITCENNNCIEIYSDDIIIDLQGVNTLNRGEGDTTYANAAFFSYGSSEKNYSLTIRNTGTLNVNSPTLYGFRQYYGTLIVKDGAQVHLNGKYGLEGGQAGRNTLLMRGDNTKLVTNGTSASLRDFNTIYLLDGLAITQPAGAHLVADTIHQNTYDIILSSLRDADGNIIGNQDVVFCKPSTSQYCVGDINADNKVDVSDVNIVINIMLGKAQASSYPGHADVTGDGRVDVSDVNMIINIMLGKLTPEEPEEEILAQTFTVGGVSFRMAKVKGGTFTMGATSEQAGEAQSNESPAHSVTLSDYFIGETEVTQELWQVVMGSNPSQYYGMTRPVDYVSWNDCQTFITKLNQMTGKTFRLPTEAEWEYAARGGDKSQGNKYSGILNDVTNVAWYIDNSNSKTHVVGKKIPNELGLYDMSGNVWEWCSDWYGSYSSSAQTNPTGPASGSYKVARGGNSLGEATTCRVSRRQVFTTTAHGLIGLRLVID